MLKLVNEYFDEFRFAVTLYFLAFLANSAACLLLFIMIIYMYLTS